MTPLRRIWQSELSADLDALVDTPVHDLVQLYCGVLTGLLDKHCPVVKVRCRPKKATSWFDADCRTAHRHAQTAERRFRRSRSTVDKLEWDKKMKLMRSLYNNKHDAYWRNEITVNKGNMQRLWRTLHGVLGDSASDDASPFSADDYAKYFKDKIDSVRVSTAATPAYDVLCQVTSSFAEFTAVTADDVAKLISCATNKTPQNGDKLPKFVVFWTISTIKNEKSAAKFHYIKTVSGKVVAQSIAFRLVSIYWQGVAPFPSYLNAKGPTPIGSTCVAHTSPHSTAAMTSLRH